VGYENFKDENPLAVLETINLCGYCFNIFFERKCFSFSVPQPTSLKKVLQCHKSMKARFKYILHQTWCKNGSNCPR